VVILLILTMAGAPAAHARTAHTPRRPALERTSAPAAIVFTRLQSDRPYTEIWTMGAHGGNQHRMTRNDVPDFDPVWSPDGSRIAWVRQEYANGPADVWVMNADGSNRHDLTNDRASINRPSWSPDGSRLVFQLEGGIYVIDADGSHEVRISPGGSLDVSLAWSPDGSSIAFASEGDGGFDLFTMSPDGTDRRQLTHTRGIVEYRPAWSPDGQRIAFMGDHATSSWHVDVMRADGSGLHILVQPYSLDPAWSPDGSKLAFYACVDDCALYRVRLGGGGFGPLGRHRGISDSDPDYRDVLPTTT
jgi:Tol biopolymer transport system component